MSTQLREGVEVGHAGGRYIPLARYPLRPYLVRQLPQPFARSHNVIPLVREGDLLTVATADPENRSVLAELRRLMASEVVPLVSSRAEIQMALDRVWAPAQQPTLRVEGAQGAEETELAERLALALYLPWVRLERYRVNPALCAVIPRQLAERWQLVVLLVEQPELVIASPTLPPEAVLGEIRDIVGLSPRLVLCTPAEARRALEQAYAPQPRRAAASQDRLAEQLVRCGVVDSARLATIQAVSRQTGEPIGQLLVRLGLVTQAQLEEAAARLLGVQRIPLAMAEIDRSLLALVPEPLARRFHFLPVRGFQGGLTLAMADPADGIAQGLAEGLLGQTVRPALCNRAELDHALETLYRDLPKPVGLKRKPLGEYLIRSGWLSVDQVAQGLKLQRKSGRRLGECLLELGFLDEEDLAEMLALQSQLPWVSPQRHSIPAALFDLVPEDLARSYTLLPLQQEGRLLTVATTDPQERSGAEAIRLQTGLEVRLVLAAGKAVREAIDQYYQLQLSRTPEGLLKLGDDLVRGEFLTRPDLLKVWRHSQEKEVPFDVAVTELGLMSEERLAQAIADHLRLPRVELRYRTEPVEVLDGLGRRRLIMRRIEPFDRDVARLLPEEVALALAAIPVRRVGGELVVAFANPLEGEALAVVRDRLGQPVSARIATRAEIAEAIRRVHNRKVLGDLLLDADLVSRRELEEGLELHRRTGVPLGKTLVSLGHITHDQLVATLAKQQSLPYFDLSGVEIDEEVARSVPEMIARQQKLLPLYRVGDTLTVAMVDPRDQEAVAEVQAITGCRVKPVLTAEEDLEEALERVYRGDYLWQSANDLMYRYPDDSAARVLTLPQKLFGLGFLGLSAVLLILNPVGYLTFLVSVSTLVSLSFSTYKFYLMYKALSHTLEVDVTPEEVAALDDRELPIYTVLVPLYREAEVLPTLVAAIADLDYPKAKLDVKLLLEEDDQETIQAVNRHPLPSHIKPVVVPNALPKGKPKACNYGLLHAEGEFVVIYDAEDVPERDQLKKAVAAFRKADPRVDCIQAKLNYYNRDQNILTRWFTTEYSMWFDLFIPGLDASNAPIPLGGTSNHFRTARLRELGAWDPYNVTEDADLGIRLFKAGGKTAVIDSTTYEEANSDLYNWIRQRSRWVKGYIQTWLVHMRHPLRLMREIGPYAFFSFNMVVGGTFFGFLVNPIYWLLTALWFLTHWGLIQQLFPGPVFYLGAIGLYFGNFAFMYTNVAGCMRRGYYDMVKYALLSPLYWALMSVGAWKGFLQLFYRPSYWEKTKHGLYRGEINTAPAATLGDLL